MHFRSYLRKKTAMKKFKKIICVFIIICMLFGAVFAGLVFMGVISLGGAYSSEENREDIQDENEMSEEFPWHIVFKGYAFSVEPVGIAIVHESGCLNIRSCDEYLIQLDVEDNMMADFWDNREQLKKNIEKSGYVFELAPQKCEIQGMECVRYIVSCENERGSKFDKTYFYQLIYDAVDGQRFFISIRFDGIDVDALSGEEKASVYEKAACEVSGIVAAATPTDETNDMVGSYWQAEKNIAIGETDSLMNGDAALSYTVPENYSLLSENISGKTYYGDDDKITVMTSIVPYTWMSAADLADKKSRAGISSITGEGQCEVNGVKFYYYTYSILYIKNGNRSMTYHFNAYADLKCGDIYTVSGFADDNPDAVETDTYYDFMSIMEK